MKILSILITILFLHSCKNSVNKANEYYDEAIRIMATHSSSNMDSLEHALSLIDKAIYLCPDSVKYLNLKANYYFNLGENNYAKDYLLKSWNKSKKDYTVGVLLGLFYEDSKILDSARICYNDAYNSILSNYRDTTDVYIMIEKKWIERLLYDSVNFSDVEHLINTHKDSTHLKDMARTISKSSRAELINNVTKSGK